MGNCFSDPSHKEGKGGGQKLGSGPVRPSGASGAGAGAGQTLGGAGGAASNQRYNEPPRTLGGGTGGLSEEEQRLRMVQAAEERAKASASKGVSASNPKSGQLSAQLAAERRAKNGQAQTDERLMDKGQWN